jgi:hypothetical protein
VQGTPVQEQQDRSDGHRGDGRGRDCPKDRDRPSSSEAANPPV